MVDAQQVQDGRVQVADVHGGSREEEDLPLDAADLDLQAADHARFDGDEARDLAERISNSGNMTFRGVQHYAGHLMHIEGFEARRDRSLALWETVAGRVERLVEAGFPCEVVTGCGTGTFNIDCDVDVVTDLQVGSYIFMDQEYRLIGGEESELFDDFEVTLTAFNYTPDPLSDVTITGWSSEPPEIVPPVPFTI